MVNQIKKMIYLRLIKMNIVRQKIFNINGRNVLLTNLNENSLLTHISVNGFDSYENETVTLIKNYPWELGTFLDVGANVGFYSILGELYLSGGVKIVAVEPFPKNIQYIKKIKLLNSLDFDLYEAAIDSSAGHRSFHYPVGKRVSRLALNAGLINQFKGTSGIFNQLRSKTLQVTTQTLSEIVAPLSGPFLIKLDCERNELPILQSSNSVLNRNDVDFIVEIMINDDDKEECFAIMRKHGFQGFLITNAGLVREDRPITLPNPNRKDRTLWRNHFFSKREISEVKKISEKIYGHWL